MICKGLETAQLTWDRCIIIGLWIPSFEGMTLREGNDLDRFSIVGKKDLFPSQLSGGQQQLVGVARALISNPKLLLVDEPTGNLHSGQGEEIMQLFAELNKTGTTIIQVTHSEKNATYGNRIIKLMDGWLVDEEK